MRSAFLASFAFPVLFQLGAVVASAEVIPTAEQMKAFLKNRAEHDEIRWKDTARGAPLKVRILSVDAKGVTLEKTLAAGMTARVVPLAELSGVSFEFSAPELTLHRKPSAATAPALKVLWDSRSGSLGMDGTNVSETGVALAKSLRLTGEEESFAEAAVILERIRGKETAEFRIAPARAEAETLELARSIKSGKAEETDKLAWKITESENNPDAMLLATAWLADRSFADLKKIEADNPRWIEDDEVKPVRERLYNLALDFALYPSLFLGTRGEESSIGLKKAWQIHHFTHAPLLAKQTLEDLAALYPDSEAAKETATELARLKALEASGKLTEPKPEPEADKEEKDEPAEEETKAPGPSGPAKKYNLFGD